MIKPSISLIYPDFKFLDGERRLCYRFSERPSAARLPISFRSPRRRIECRLNRNDAPMLQQAIEVLQKTVDDAALLFSHARV